MKKSISLLTVMVILLMSLTLSVSADNFVPSISYKPAPEIVVDGGNNIGDVVDTQGTILYTAKDTCIVITPVSEARTSTRIPAEAADILLDVYDELMADETRLSDLSEELNTQVERALGDGKDADYLVVKDLFDVSVICEELATKLAPVGNTIDLKFNVALDAGDPIFVMTYKDGEWSPIEAVVNNGDGTITCTFEHFCPVAFFVVSPEGPSPDTGVNDSTYIWAIIMVASALAIALIAVANKRASSKIKSKDAN